MKYDINLCVYPVHKPNILFATIVKDQLPENFSNGIVTLRQ
jgi:hypothetical protein